MLQVYKRYRKLRKKTLLMCNFDSSFDKKCFTKIRKKEKMKEKIILESPTEVLICKIKISIDYIVFIPKLL